MNIIINNLMLELKQLKEDISIYSIALGFFLFMFFFFIVGHNNNMLNAELETKEIAMQTNEEFQKINQQKSTKAKVINTSYSVESSNEFIIENKLKSKEIDQELADIQYKEKKSSRKSTKFIVYTVKHGDYLEKIAKKYKVKVKSIMEINVFDNPNLIYAGYKIKIPA